MPSRLIGDRHERVNDGGTVFGVKLVKILFR